MIMPIPQLWPSELEKDTPNLATHSSHKQTHSQLHHHDDLRLVVVGCQALHQFGVMQVIHELDLSSRRLSLLLTAALVELASVNVPCFLVFEAKHLTKLPP